MEIDQEDAPKRRLRTEKGLKEERHKWDNLLEQKRKSLEDESDEKIRLDRVDADHERELKRAEDDFDKPVYPIHSTGSQSLHQCHKGVIRERKRSDKAQEVERAKEDRNRRAERVQKRLISEAHHEGERRDTDNDTGDERARTDLEALQNSNRLLDEKVSHDLTKIALVTRDQFLAVVSHDLKNPLFSISMSASLMRDDLMDRDDDVDSLLGYLEIIERNAANMDRMISDLLDVERMTNGKLNVKLERIDICMLLHECRNLFAPVIANKTFSITVETCHGSLFADADSDRVFQVLSNLAGNALKFTPKGGSIALSAQEKTEGEIQVSVTDNGPGIPQEKKTQIFERFSQLGTNDRRGLGLGLFISKWIVESHKGRIWVSSEVGKGSTFTFTLPVSRR